MEDRTVIQPATSSGSVRRGVRLNGTYELGTLIAHGGMGEVYRGFNIVTKDPVAIKMILPELASNPDAFAMFLREASTLHNLQHEAIVRYFVFSVDPDLQRAYLAMEFVDGPSLSKRLAKGPLPIEDVRVLQRRLAGALDAAHRVGVIHRDISSDNVILPDDNPQQAKIIDFGIARSKRAGEGTIIGGGFAGKYNYVSPEQLGLAGGEVTAKSDIYSLGLVLAEALRGRPINMSGSQAEIIEKRRKIPDLSDIDPTMRPLIAAMLQPSPADRPESMAAVAAWTSGASTWSRSSAGGQDQTRSGFARTAAIVAALIVIVSIGGTLYSFRDLLPFGQSSSSVAPPPPSNAAGAAPKPEPKQEASAEPGVSPEHKLPPLPKLPDDKPEAAPNNAPSDRPPAPVGPSTQESPPTATPSKPEQPPVLADQPIQHVPTADEILNTVSAAKNKEAVAAPNAFAPNETPSKPTTTADEILNTLLASKSKQGDVVASNQPASNETPTKPPPSPAQKEPKVEPPAPRPPSPGPESSSASTHNLPPLPEPPLPAQTTPDGVAEASQGKPTVVASNPPLGGDSPPPANSSPSPIRPEPRAETSPSGPRAPQDLLALGEATVGKNFVADLPPFGDSGDPKSLVLRADPGLPEGLVLSDLGSGLAEISGNPGKAGRYSFDIVAKDASGASARMAAKLVVLESPLQASTQAPPVASGDLTSNTPAAKAAGFLRDFDGGPCFMTRSLGVSGGSPVILGVGADKTTFERFYAGFNRDVGVEPTMTVQLIARSQCPAIELIEANGARAADAPKIEVANRDVGRNKPLAGSVSNLAGRNLTLLMVSTDGQVHRIETHPRIAGSSATFSVPFSSDAPPGDVMQMVVALVSRKPLPSLADFKSGAAADILPRVQNDLTGAGGSLETEFFRLVN